MLKPLLLTRWLLLLLGLLVAPRLWATHIQAAEISYQKLSGTNQYKVSYRVYRDCGGASFPTSSAVLEYRQTGCTGGPWPSVPLLLVPGTQRIGGDYCAALGSPCGPGLPTNYETGLFEATLTLPPAEWTLSVTLNARPELGNINIGSGDMYTEATLDNRNGRSNSSPVFSSSSQVVSFVGWRLPTTFSEMAVDPDGDSLVYELVAPLESCGSPMTYLPIQSPIVEVGSTPACYAALPTGTTYSPTWPLLSFQLTGSCPLKQAQPYFDFNPANGSISMIPQLFNPTVNSAQNKNVVAVKVSEYRRLAGGSYVKVGSVRRDMLFTVVDCGTNQNPTLGPVTVNNGPAQSAGAVIPVVAGQLVQLSVGGLDGNGNQILTMSSNVEQVLPNSELTLSPPSLHPTAQINWIPPTTLPSGLYYCTVTTTDNACPIKGVHTQTLTFRVTNNTLTAVKAAKAVTTLAAAPTPFQGQVRFQLAQAGVQPVLVFDQLGRQVAALQSSPAGEVQWRPAAGVPAGLYLARTPDGLQVARLLRTGAE